MLNTYDILHSNKLIISEKAFVQIDKQFRFNIFIYNKNQKQKKQKKQHGKNTIKEISKERRKRR